MEFKKLFPFFDHSPLTFKKRVLSGFALGLLASLLLFSLLSAFSSSSTSSSFFSWVFSVPDDDTSAPGSTPILPDQDSATSSSPDLGTAHVANATANTTLSSNSSSSPILEKSQDASATDLSSSSTGESKNSSFFLVPEGQVIESVHLDNSSKDDGKNGGARGGDLGVQAQNVSAANGNDHKVEVGERNVKCDIFNGRWVRDDRAPFYAPGSCPHIDIDFDCHRNGRPDDRYLRWRWQPNDCDIPRMNATDFLERLRGKRLIFVGDSLNRNMWESLVCILRDSVKRKERVYEASGRHNFKTKGYYSFKFEDYNCSVDFVRSTFLVREVYFKNANGSDDERLRLDLLDETTSAYREADIVVFNTGHWWTHEKTSRGIDYYQEGNHVYPLLKVMEAFQKALTTWANWIDKNIDSNKTQVVFRGYSLTHFSGGQWNSGGQCHKETEPIFNETFLTKYPSKMRALERVMGEMKTPVIYLNVSRLTDYRKDGHPSIYRKKYNSVEEHRAAELSQDCSHWCLPGVPDTWNELLYASLLVNGKGSWRL